MTDYSDSSKVLAIPELIFCIFKYTHVCEIIKYRRTNKQFNTIFGFKFLWQDEDIFNIHFGYNNKPIIPSQYIQ